MAVSGQLTKLADELTKLAARAQDAENRATEARGKARADLEEDRDAARASAQAQSEKLHAKAEEGRGNISAWWSDVQKSWDAHVAELRDRVDTKKAEHDVHVAQRRAEHAEADAAYAIDFAYGAVVEAEYAVLDAVLARTDAEELTQGAGATA